MGNALVVQRSRLPQSSTSLRAAQYVRMSTDYQRYSIENQAAVIATYAKMHQLSIVRTYSDKGESGLKLKNRAGLIQLLDDVQSGRADFNHILVYDVSRWGRFQDTDESAHYEFICKKAGVKVAYCAEQFDNDGTMMSNILKNLKRVMAAEYSRELSAKVHAGASRYARMGFVLGGQASYGLSRQLVDEKLRPKALLKNGDRKYLVTDHVRLVPGTTDETAIVRWVFERFLRKKSETAIARELNRMAVPTNTGRPWNRFTIGRLLRNENYIGNLIYNRRSAKLREKRNCNPPELWIRSEGSVEAIVERNLFLRARKVIEERRVSLSEEEMLTRLRKTLMKRGKLSPAIIDGTVGLPCTATYMNRLGSLRNVYRLIGYTPKRDYEYLESRARWADLNTKLASQVAAEIKQAGGGLTVQGEPNCLLVNETVSIFFRVARWCAGKRENHAPHWSIHHRDRNAAGWIVAIRLAERNTGLLDYLLLPTQETVRPLIRFSETARGSYGIDRYETFDALARSLIRRITKKSRALETKSDRSKRPRKAIRSRSKAGAATKHRQLS
jgi:DNA invertase Pin-like site-specific DNA recombinase